MLGRSGDERTYWVLSLLIRFSVSCQSSPVNVRTVLWDNSDLYRSCWVDRDIATLRARQLYQLILPTEIPSDVSSLAEHFKRCLEAVNDVASTQETHELMMRPMVDAIGGYVHSIGVPLANQRYYEGSVTYDTARQVNELSRAIKKILSTDGGKWTRPIRALPPNEIRPYEVRPPAPIDNHCNDLISNVDSSLNGSDEPLVSLPFLDSKTSPTTVTIPFRNKSQYGLFEKDSADILLRYYTAASDCYELLSSPVNAKRARRSFECSFQSWIQENVVPHLKKSVWYPAFGSVYRILENMADKECPCEPSDDCPKMNSSWFFVACICGFLSLFWSVVFAFVLMERMYGRRVCNDNIISYNADCKSSHTDELQSIIDNYYEGSSSDEDAAVNIKPSSERSNTSPKNES